MIEALAAAFVSHFNIDKRSEFWTEQKTLGAATEMCHVASLMHDDVVDHAKTRRGQPSINARWDENYAIFSGNFAISSANALIAELRHEEVK